MSCISVTNITILDNPSLFLNPLQFEISFECIRELKEDLNWKVIYVGSSESEHHDQELDSILLGPIRQGVNRFVFQVDPPDVNKIPRHDLLGVTVLLITCSYKGREFVRVGYYVNNEDPDAPPLVENIDGTFVEQPRSADIDITKIIRNILADKPRITQFPIPWDDDEMAAAFAAAAAAAGQVEKTDIINNNNNNSNTGDGFFDNAPMETA